MRWLPLLILLVIAVAGLRVYLTARRRKATRREDWDAKLIRQLREQGLDPFAAHEVDFFFDLPNHGAARAVSEKLKTEGFSTDMSAHSDSDSERISLHARKSMRLVTEEVTALSERFKSLAEGLGGRYDGWTVRRGA
ncbi:MAG TPA: ribonuclease E inhibitor RraB [Steroidobacteraceae bacterium]|nr:ribonuclease E inhibitor RraB [Steroidobacteraceae bacterium]